MWPFLDFLLSFGIFHVTTCSTPLEYLLLALLFPFLSSLIYKEHSPFSSVYVVET